MKIYDSTYAEKNLDGNMMVWSASSEELWKGQLIDIPEFAEALLKQIAK